MNRPGPGAARDAVYATPAVAGIANPWRPQGTAPRGLTRRECIGAGLGAALALPSQAQAIEIGAVFEWPAIRLLDGATLEPSSWRGQGAVVVLWATYCPFCKRHNAHIDKLYRATRAAHALRAAPPSGSIRESIRTSDGPASSKGQPLRILGLAMDTDAQAVRRYMAVNNYRFPVAPDMAALAARLTARRVIPMTLLFDHQSRLLQAIPGEMSEDDVLELGQTVARMEKSTHFIS